MTSYEEEYNNEMADTGNSILYENLMGFRLGYFLIITLVVILLAGVGTLIWKYYAAYRRTRREQNDRQREEAFGASGFPEHVYANEITPGFVLLQTQDGQFFRILQEYGAQTEQVNGNHSAYGAVGWRTINEIDELHFSPDMTSTFYQTSSEAALGDSEQDHLIAYDSKQ